MDPGSALHWFLPTDSSLAAIFYGHAATGGLLFHTTGCTSNLFDMASETGTFATHLFQSNPITEKSTRP